MLETITKKLAVGISGLALIAGCASEKEPLVEECCNNISCNESNYTCEKSEEKSSRAYDSGYHCITIDNNTGATYNVCCECEYHEPVVHDKGI